MTVRVDVNLTWIAPGRVGGSEEYLVRQLAGLADVDADVGEFDVGLLCTPSFVAAHPGLAARYRVATTPVDRDNRAMRIAFEHTWLAARTRRADIVHHGGGTTPLAGRSPIVLTVHDLQYLAYPEYFDAARRRYLEAMLPRSVRRAAVVATPSEFVRGTVIEAFAIEAERVVVVPHGVPRIERPSPDVVADARDRHGVGSRPYVLYPAITHPHKRHDVLVAMLDELDDGTALVLLGGQGSADAQVNELIRRSSRRGRIVRPGRVSVADRDALLAGADALVFPSAYEGFGAPLVEAMELGVPVVSSDAPAVSEVVGDAAIVVPTFGGLGTDEPSAWAAGVRAARSGRDALVAKGRDRRAAFTLAASGDALARAYRIAAAGDRP